MMVILKMFIDKLPMQARRTNNFCVYNSVKIFIDRNHNIVCDACIIEYISRIHINRKRVREFQFK